MTTLAFIPHQPIAQYFTCCSCHPANQCIHDEIASRSSCMHARQNQKLGAVLIRSLVNTPTPYVYTFSGATCCLQVPNISTSSGVLLPTQLLDLLRSSSSKPCMHGRGDGDYLCVCSVFVASAGRGVGTDELSHHQIKNHGLSWIFIQFTCSALLCDFYLLANLSAIIYSVFLKKKKHFQPAYQPNSRNL